MKPHISTTLKTPTDATSGVHSPANSGISTTLKTPTDATEPAPSITLLSGGVGGAKLALGFYQHLKQRYGSARTLTVVANSGDDWEWLGLRVCPDADILLYTLAGVVNPDQGWGVEGDTLTVMEQVAKLGGEGWFQLGDKDLALCLQRTQWLKQGHSLSEVFSRLTERFQLECSLLPACDAYAPTQLRTSLGWLHLQEYLVREKARPPVYEITQPQLDQATASAEVMHAIQGCDILVFAPSNPYISIGPILNTPGVKRAVLARLQTVRPQTARPKRGPSSIAVSPMVGEQALKGPLAHMLQQFHQPCNALGVLAEYQQRLHPNAILHYVMDTQDAHLAPQVRALKVVPHLLPIVMHTAAEKTHLAQCLLNLIPPGHC